MGLYEQVRDVAKEKGYSINKLEKELGFARSSINKFNKNKPGMDKIQMIADFLDVSPNHLLGWKEPDIANADILADIAADSELLECVKKIKEQTLEKRREIFSFIDFVCQK